MNRKDFDSINDTMKENSYTTTFIKDYILRFRMADIANNAIEYSAYGASRSYDTTSRICEKYNESADDIINEYNNKIRVICDKDNIKTYCGNDDTEGLVDEINKTKKLYFEKIIKQYNDVESFGYNSGRISDMMLYDEYLNYITSDDFYYDDSNPYIVELLYHITTFLQIRSRLEFNGSNIAELVSKFNTMCDDTIRKYWDDKMYDYYGRMRQIFMFDFYSSNDDDFIEANIYDENRVTLYTKVMRYLEALCNYTPPKKAEEKYMSMDLQSILNNVQIQDTETEKTAKQLHENLRKIAIFFVQLRKIESDVDPRYFEQFIDKDYYNDLFTLKEQLGDMSVREYIINYNSHQTNINEVGLESITSRYLSFEMKYIDPFKRLVNKESSVLRKLADRAILSYRENNEKISSGVLFDEFVECEWSGKSIIYKDGKPCDFYYVYPPKTGDASTGDTSVIVDDYQFTEDSTRTRYGVTDMEYWRKYCCVATIANCMMPMYWPTGIIIAGHPIPMPIIYIPFVVLSSRVTVVIGLGICGISALPMILFVNMSDIPGSLIPQLNNTIDTITERVRNIPSSQIDTVKSTIRNLIEKQDNIINKCTRMYSDIKEKIKNVQNGVSIDMETFKNLRYMRGEDPTTNTTQRLSNI